MPSLSPVVESLLEMTEEELLPAAHTSSHWQHYGNETIVKRHEGNLILRAAGFTGHSKTNLLGTLLCKAERLSYARVTNRWKSYPQIWKMAKHLARDLQVGMTRHEWSSAVVLAILVDHLAAHQLSPKTVALIGDGDGFLGALMCRWFSDTAMKIYSIDLPKILIFQAQTYERADPRRTLSVLLPGRPATPAEVTLVHPDAIEQIACDVDCAISVVSLQEMNEFSVRRYFDFLRRRSTPQSRWYCVNRVRNTLPGGEVSDFFRYPWRDDDEVFLDGPCPYLTHFFDQHQYPNGPRLFGARVPLVNYFDGRAWHRLVRLVPEPR
jgi:hypothetical protein